MKTARWQHPAVGTGQDLLCLAPLILHHGEGYKNDRSDDTDVQDFDYDY